MPVSKKPEPEIAYWGRWVGGLWGGGGGGGVSG